MTGCIECRENSIKRDFNLDLDFKYRGDINGN